MRQNVLILTSSSGIWGSFLLYFLNGSGLYKDMLFLSASKKVVSLPKYLFLKPISVSNALGWEVGWGWEWDWLALGCFSKGWDVGPLTQTGWTRGVVHSGHCWKQPALQWAWGRREVSSCCSCLWTHLLHRRSAPGKPYFRKPWTRGTSQGSLMEKKFSDFQS